MKKAVFAGSFDPITNGHVDIIKRAAAICDELTVAVVANPNKAPLFSLEERKRIIAEVLAAENIKAEVDSFEGLLTDYVLNGGFDAVIRGIRNSADFEFEYPWAQQNARFYKGNAETVFLISDPAYSFVSSSSVKEILSLGADVSEFVPKAVIKHL